MRKKINISFRDLSEEQIQVIIGTIYHEQGFKIDYLHISDRSNEDGADLIVSKGETKIAISVKKKPATPDRPQLLDLDRRSENKKIYVYTSTPTKKFLDYMKEFPEVEFWDRDHLNGFIRMNNPYFFANLVFREHETIARLDLIKTLFFKIWSNNRNKEKQKIKEMSKSSINQLWRLKDFSVILHKIPNHTRFLFEEPLKIKDESLDDHFLNLFLGFMDSLEKDCGSFVAWFLEFYGQNEELVNNSIIEMGDRSHWYHLNAFKTNIEIEEFIKDLKEDFEDPLKQLDKLKKQAKDGRDKEYFKYIEEMAKSNNVWKAIGNQIKQLYTIGYFLEEAIDDILCEYLRDYTLRYHEDSPFRE
ncbi:restriction endonuclease [Candidatus Pacearchaeota archaeon]|nr:restriction endonuclease [Candidatus Pacearchaeota archaeon]